MNISIKDILGARAGEKFKKTFPNISKYFEKFYNLDDLSFDFSKNDKVITRSSMGDDYDTHECHIQSHIGFDMEWAIDKIYKAHKKARGEHESGSFTPSWFEDSETLSEILEEFLQGNKMFLVERMELETWAQDRDINFNNRKTSRKVFYLQMPYVTGKAIVNNTSYDKHFDCHGVVLVFEYTASHDDGEMALYDAYPFLTKADYDAVRKAREEYMRNKNQK